MSIATRLALVALMPLLFLATPGHAQFGDPVPPVRAVALYGDRLIPLEQFWIAFPDVCPNFHFHAARGGVVTALDGTVVPDPNSGSCGYGVLGSFFVGTAFVIALPDVDFDGIFDGNDFSTHPDSDGDGIPDGSEDHDSDGLGYAEELILGTHPFQADSNRNGSSDRIDSILASTARDFTKIPLIANLYQGSGATRAHLEDAVMQANKILKKAKLMFLIVDVNENVNTGDDGAGSGTAGDGRFTVPEGDQVKDNGLTEVGNLPMMKGFKASFAQAGGGVEVGSTTPGLSWHRQGSVICEQRASTKLTGATLAHELIHVLTLDHPTPGTPEDTPGNIMTPSNAGRDDFVNSPDADKGIDNVTLTPGQLAQITTDGIVPQLGLSGTRQSPARKKEYESGRALDPKGDQTGGQPSYLDLHQIQAGSDEFRRDVHLLISLAGQFAATGQYDAVYRLLFNADNSDATGSTEAGAPGIDVEVQIVLHRDATNGLTAAARKYSPPGQNRRALFPQPTILPITIRADDITLPDEVRADLLELSVAKTELGLTADTVPVTVVSQTSEFGPIVDSTSFLYDRKRWQKDPTLALTQEFAIPGQTVPFTVSGLAPNTGFDLRFDDTILLSATLDSAGAYSGSFAIPAGAMPAFHFLSAQDPTGAFAFGGIVVGIDIFKDGFE